jgi:hypothetical protein
MGAVCCTTRPSNETMKFEDIRAIEEEQQLQNKMESFLQQKLQKEVKEIYD